MKKGLYLTALASAAIMSLAPGCATTSNLNDKISDMRMEHRRDMLNLEKRLFVLAQGVFVYTHYDTALEDIYDVAHAIVWARDGQAKRNEKGDIILRPIGGIAQTDQVIAKVIKEIAGEDNEVTLAELSAARQRLPLEYKIGNY